MSSFFYFTEQAKAPVTLEQAQAWGLGYAFEATPASTEISGRTPSGGKGWLFFDAVRVGNAFIGYRPGLQEWLKIPNSEIWVGYDKALRPGPQSLARKDHLSGILFEMGDRNQWSIPRLTYFKSEHGFVSNLVRYLTLTEDGSWQGGRVKGGHDGLVDLGDRLAAALVYRLIDDSIPELTVDEAADAVSQLLQANYFASAAEVALLELLPEDQLLAICEAVVDADTAIDFVKKNGVAGC